MSMYQKPILAASLAILLLTLNSCMPDKHVVWSPEGSKALVRMGNDELFILEGPELAPRSLDMKVFAMDWLPDNRRAVVCVSREHADWTSLKAASSAAEIEEVTQEAQAIETAVLAFDGPIHQAEWNQIPAVQEGLSRPVQLCLRDTASAAFRAKAATELEKLKSSTAFTFHLLLIDTSEAKEPTLLYSTMARKGKDEGYPRPFVDPTGDRMAFLLNRPEQYLGDAQPAFALAVQEINDPDSMRIVDEQVGWNLAWSPDGQQLAYFRYKGDPPPEMDEDVLSRLGTLVIQRIADDTGQVNPRVVAEVGVLFQSLAGLQFAPDGNLYFAAMDFHLPATEEMMPEAWTVFRWDPDYPSFVYPVLSQDTERWFAKPHELSWTFALSPNGQRLQLLGQDGLYLQDFPSAGGPHLDAVHTDEHGTAPVWRNDDEITLVVEPGDERGSEHRSELVLMKLNRGGYPESARCLSCDWPDEWVSGWFERK